MKILVVVKTSPVPSTLKSVLETVCTAGVREDGSWVRIYPISFRFLPEHMQYDKYQWIELEVIKAKGDIRPESYRPTNVGGIRLGDHVGSERSWIKRRDLVIPSKIMSMCELEKCGRAECSLAVIKPRRVMAIKHEKDNEDWSEKFKTMFAQLRLFENQISPLKKIPYKFYYHFLCADLNCGSHTKQILDWELSELFWKELYRLGTEELAVNSVKYKFLDTMCATDRDTHFYVGTDFRHNSWMVTGVFWPRRTSPMLFTK